MKNFNLTNDFNKILENNKIVIFQYGTSTCAPCHSLKNKLTDWKNKIQILKYIIYLLKIIKSLLHKTEFYPHLL